jgi:hypothetical protein
MGARFDYGDYSVPEDDQMEPESSLRGERIAGRWGFWQYKSPCLGRCCICERGIQGDRVLEERPTAPGARSQTWAYCKACWDLHLAVCGGESR